MIRSVAIVGPQVQRAESHLGALLKQAATAPTQFVELRESVHRDQEAQKTLLTSLLQLLRQLQNAPAMSVPAEFVELRAQFAQTAEAQTDALAFFQEAVARLDDAIPALQKDTAAIRAQLSDGFRAQDSALHVLRGLPASVEKVMLQIIPLAKDLRGLDAHLKQAGQERVNLLKGQDATVKQLAAVQANVKLLGSGGEPGRGRKRLALPVPPELPRLESPKGSSPAALPPHPETSLALHPVVSPAVAAAGTPAPQPARAMPDPFRRMTAQLTEQLHALLRETVRDHNAAQAEVWAREPLGVQFVGNLLGVLAMEEILTAETPLQTGRNAAVLVGRALELIAQRADKVPPGFLPWLQAHRSTLYTIAARHLEGLFTRWLQVAPQKLLSQTPAFEELRQREVAAQQETERLKARYEPDQHDDRLVKLMHDVVKLQHWIAEAQERRGRKRTYPLLANLALGTVHKAAVAAAYEARQNYYYRPHYSWEPKPSWEGVRMDAKSEQVVYEAEEKRVQELRNELDRLKR